MDPRNIDWTPLTTLLVLPSGCISADERLALLSLEQAVFEGRALRFQQELFDAVSGLSGSAPPDERASYVVSRLGGECGVVVSGSRLAISLRAGPTARGDREWSGRVWSTIELAGDAVVFHEQRYALRHRDHHIELRGSAVMDRDDVGVPSSARLQMESSAACWTLLSDDTCEVPYEPRTTLEGFQIGHGPELGLVREMVGLELSAGAVVPHAGTVVVRGLIGTPTPERTMIQEFHRLDADRVEINTSGTRGDFVSVLDSRTGARLA